MRLAIFTVKTKSWKKTVFGIFRGFSWIFGGSGVDFRTPCEVLHILDPTGARETQFEPVFGPRLFLGFFWEVDFVFLRIGSKEKLFPLRCLGGALGAV